MELPGTVHKSVISHPWYKLPLFSAFLSFAVLGAISIFLVQKILHATSSEAAAEMDYWAQAFAIRLEGQLSANLAVGYGLEAQISVLGELGQTELEIVAPRLLDRQVNIRNIALAPDLVINAVYPLEENRAVLGLDYSLQEDQAEQVLQAMALNQVILAGPLELVQGGGKHLIARFPVRRIDGSDWGLISLVIDCESLLRDAGFHDIEQKYRIAVRSGTGHISGDTTVFDGAGRLHPVALPGADWQIAIEPADTNALIVRKVIWWTTALIACLLAATAVYYLRRYNLQREFHVHELESLAAIDPLTQLTSRYQFHESLEHLIDECNRSKQGFTVLFIDLDHFKEINDSMGHAAGDQMLINIAAALRSCVRRYDLLCRLSGDEFVVVFKGTTLTSEIESRARVIMSRVGQSMDVNGKQISVTCSVGVAVYPADGTDAVSLIQHADLAMFESKRIGRNGLYFFNMSMRNEADRYIELSSAIRRALTDGAFEVYYQPIYDVAEKRFTRCEALCRWRTADGKFVSPMDFIPVAEQSGLISELGNRVTEQALLFCSELLREGYAINMSINRSPQEFTSRQNTQYLIDMRRRLGIPSTMLTLEITESLLMSDNCVKTENFKLFKDQQFQFSIDDFGTGYSAINYLRKYPVESLKIDKSFISEFGKSQQATILVRIIMQMAKSLKIKVVAEGVETREQMALLSEIGCDYLQGFYFAKPMPKAEFIRFLKESEAGGTAQQAAITPSRNTKT